MGTIMKPVYSQITEKKLKGEKSFAVLIDPDKVNASSIKELTAMAVEAKVDFLFVGGSLVISDHLDDCIKAIREANASKGTRSIDIAMGIGRNAEVSVRIGSACPNSPSR